MVVPGNSGHILKPTNSTLSKKAREPEMDRAALDVAVLQNFVLKKKLSQLVNFTLRETLKFSISEIFSFLSRLHGVNVFVWSEKNLFCEFET